MLEYIKAWALQDLFFKKNFIFDRMNKKVHNIVKLLREENIILNEDRKRTCTKAPNSFLPPPMNIRHYKRSDYEDDGGNNNDIVNGNDYVDDDLGAKLVFAASRSAITQSLDSQSFIREHSLTVQTNFKYLLTFIKIYIFFFSFNNNIYNLFYYISIQFVNSVIRDFFYFCFCV